MKKFLLFAAAMLTASTMMAGEPAKALAYQPEEFDETQWTYIGEGSMSPGYFDWFGTEEGGTKEYPYALDTKVYERNSKPGDYWVEPMVDDLNPEEYLIPSQIVVHAQNPDAVWTEPYWWQHPLLFCFYHQVPEVLGYQGNAAFYGAMDEDTRVISFPPMSHVLMTLPTGQATTNNAGMFALEIPDPASVGKINQDNVIPVYYNMQGVRVDNPEHGIFIEKRGNKTTKVVK